MNRSKILVCAIPVLEQWLLRSKTVVGPPLGRQLEVLAAGNSN